MLHVIKLFFYERSFLLCFHVTDWKAKTHCHYAQTVASSVPFPSLSPPLSFSLYFIDTYIKIFVKTTTTVVTFTAHGATITLLTV